jgi:hypothetical protein
VHVSLEVRRDPPPTAKVAGADVLGSVAVQLALTFPAWVRRRRFVVSYVDDTTIHQRMSVDFSLPEPSWFWTPDPPQPGTVLYVPLHILRKETLDRFSIADEEGRRLTMLPRADNGALAVAGLLPLVVELSAGRNLPVAKLEAALREVVTGRQTPQASPSEAAKRTQHDDVLGKVLTKEDETRALVEDLAGGFLMLVPVTYAPGVDRLLKAEWDVPNYWHGRRDKQRIRRHAQSALASVGWADKVQSIPELQFGWARTTHVEIVAPAEVQMSEASLNVTQYDPDPKFREPVSTPALRTAFNKPCATLNASPRIAFDPYEPDVERREQAIGELLQCRGDTGSVDLRFRSPAHGVLLATTTASAVIVALLWFVQGTLATLDRQTTSAVLLIFPAILAAYLLRHGEHEFARRLLVGVRLAGLGVALCSLGISAMLGLVHVRTEAADGRLVADAGVQNWARGVAIAASVLAAVLLIGYLRTWLWSDLRSRRRSNDGYG